MAQKNKKVPFPPLVLKEFKRNRKKIYTSWHNHDPFRRMA